MPTFQVFAHRGYSAQFPENTHWALEGALGVGADGIELDVQSTADGAAVLIHDQRVDRTSEGTGRVEQLTLAQIQKLDAGAWFGRQFCHTPFLTLDQALTLSADKVRLNLHLKASPPAQKTLVEEVIRQVVAHQLLDTAYISCSRFELELARRLEARIAACYLGPQPRNTAIYLETSLSLGCSIVQLPYQQVNPAFVDLAHRLGVEVHALYIGQPPQRSEHQHQRQLTALIDCGVDGIMVDELELALALRDKS